MYNFCLVRQLIFAINVISLRLITIVLHHWTVNVMENTNMKKILIIEDDTGLQEELKYLLNQNGYEGIILSDFCHALECMLDSQIDLILLDITLPGIDGQYLLREFRKKSAVPVIMVTSKNTEMDEVLCMTYGADDFIAKPYNPTILLLHIEAVFRRTEHIDNSIIEYKGIRLDTGRGNMTANGKSIELTKNEMRILMFLIKSKGRIVSRDSLISDLWESEEFVDDNTLTVNITRIRKKLEDCQMADIIKTKRGQGYLLE